MEPCKVFFVFVFFVSVLYLSFFLGSFLYLFLFFPYFHFFLSIFISCEWVINRLKVGCKFSTIRFVLLLQCCLLIVCPGYIYSGDSWMAAFPSFSTTYRRYLQKAQFLRIPPPSPFCIRVCVTGPLIMKTTIEEMKWIRCKWGTRLDGCHISNGLFLYSLFIYLFIYFIF